VNNWETSVAERLKDILNAPDEKSAMKVACRQILSSLNLSTAPIALKPICQKFNLKVSYNNVNKPEDSYLKLAPFGFEIEISKKKNWRRNRFTIAHELSHIIIYNIINSRVKIERNQHDGIEALCDIGATELLINEDELGRILTTNGLNTEGVKFMYDKFLVSYDTLFTRLSDFLNMNIVIWKKHSRNDLEKEEFRVFRHFPKYKNSDKTTWLPNGCTMKHISPNIFENDFKPFSVVDDFKIIMNGKITKCSSLSFIFPHSRDLSKNLPIFDDLTISDESIYDNCYIMFITKDQQKFNTLKEYYIKNDAR